MLILDFMIWFNLSTTASQFWCDSRGTSRRMPVPVACATLLDQRSIESFPFSKMSRKQRGKVTFPRPFPVHLRRRARPRFLVFILDTQVRPSRLLAPFLFFSGRDWTRSGHSTAGLEAAGTPEIPRTTQPFYVC